jgi:hypothetical protein
MRTVSMEHSNNHLNVAVSGGLTAPAGPRGRKRRTTLQAESLATRRLLISLCLGFGFFVALVFLTIPQWTGLNLYMWLTITLVTFAGAVAFLVGTLLAAFAPVRPVESAQGSERKGNVPTTPYSESVSPSIRTAGDADPEGRRPRLTAT